MKLKFAKNRTIQPCKKGSKQIKSGIAFTKIFNLQGAIRTLAR